MTAHKKNSIFLIEIRVHDFTAFDGKTWQIKKIETEDTTQPNTKKIRNNKIFRNLFGKRKQSQF